MTDGDQFAFGTVLITAERYEQLSVGRRDVADDAKKYGKHGLANIAAMLTVTNSDRLHFRAPKHWDEAKWVQLIRKPEKQRYIVAGALLAAQIDVILYLER